MLNDIFAIVRTIRADKKGVTALEYGLIASLIAVAIITAVTAVGTGLNGTFAAVSAKL